MVISPRYCAARGFVIEQSVRDPLMLLELVAWGELDRGFALGELCQARLPVRCNKLKQKMNWAASSSPAYPPASAHHLARPDSPGRPGANLRDLSDMADASIDQAYQWLYQRHCVQFGAPTGRRSGEAQQKW